MMNNHHLLNLSNSSWHAAIAKANADISEKKHYHVGKKIVDVGFVWHPDILFQPNYISGETSLSCRKYH